MTSPINWTPVKLRNTSPVTWVFNERNTKVGYFRTQFGTWVAVKTYNTRIIRSYLIETGLLRKIKDRVQGVSPFFVEIVPEYAFGNETHIIMECCIGGNLLQYRDGYIKDYQPLQFPEEKIWRVYTSLINALLFLKYGRTGRLTDSRPPGWKQILHRDIKPDNVLVRYTGPANDQEEYVLCDFGLSLEVNGLGWDWMNPDDRAGTPYWLPPEVCVKDNLPLPNEKLDVWGVGTVVHYLALGRLVVAHKLEFNPRSRLTMENKLHIPRAPTFIDAISTGSLEGADTYPDRPIYSRKLNCKMMEALAYNPEKRASVDRLAENWPADGEVFAPFSVCHPELGPGYPAVRPSPLNSPCNAKTENRLRWGLESISGPTWAIELEGVPYDLDRRRRQRDALQLQKDKGTRRQSFGNCVDLKRPSGIEDRGNYPELEQRLARLDRSVKDRKALRQEEEDRICALKKNFNKRLRTEPGLTTSVKRLCQRISRETDIHPRVLLAQLNEQRTLPDMTFEQILAELDNPTPRLEYVEEESFEDEQPPRKRSRSEVQLSLNMKDLPFDDEDHFHIDISSSGSSIVTQLGGVAQGPAPLPVTAIPKQQGPNDGSLPGSGSSGAGSPIRRSRAPSPENEEQKGTGEEGHSDRSPTMSGDDAGDEAEPSSREESDRPSSPKSQEEPSVEIEASTSQGQSASPGREQRLQSEAQDGFVTAPETAHSSSSEEPYLNCKYCTYIAPDPRALAFHVLDTHPRTPSPEREHPQQSRGRGGIFFSREITQTSSREGSTTRAEGVEEVSPGGSATQAEGQEEVNSGGSVQPTVPEIRQQPHSEVEGIPQGEAGETAPVEGQALTSAGDEEKKEDEEDVAPRRDSGSAPGLQGHTSARPASRRPSREWWVFP